MKFVKGYIKQHVIKSIVINAISIAISLSILAIAKNFTTIHQYILRLMLPIIIVLLFSALYIACEWQKKIRDDNLYKSDSYILIATGRNFYIAEVLSILTIALGSTAVMIFDLNRVVINILVEICNEYIWIIFAYSVAYEFFSLFVEIFLGVRLNFATIITLIALIHISMDASLANALWIVSGIGLLNWSSSKESVLYYADNRLKNFEKLKDFDIPLKERIKWSRRKANALFFTMAFTISYSLKSAREVILKWFYDFNVGIYKLIGSEITVSRDDNGIEILFFLGVGCTIFLIIQNIVNNGQLRFFNYYIKVPYISNIIEEQKKVTERVIKANECNTDNQLTAIERKLDTLLSIVEYQNKKIDDLEKRLQRRKSRRRF